MEKTLGNIKHREWHDRAKASAVDYLALEQWEAPKNRLRKTSEGGIELAISLPRSQHLHDGDVLFHDPATGRIVVARIAMKEVMVIEMDNLHGLSAGEILRVSFELGHGLGNQHWPAIIKGTTIYVPLSVDRKVMTSVMRTHAFRHASMRFEPGEEVAAKLTASEVRLLFAGADATPHHHHHHHHDSKGHHDSDLHHDGSGHHAHNGAPGGTIHSASRQAHPGHDNPSSDDRSVSPVQDVRN